MGSSVASSVSSSGLNAGAPPVYIPNDNVWTLVYRGDDDDDDDDR